MRLVRPLLSMEIGIRYCARHWPAAPSGLLRCGVCEAGMSKKDIDHGRPHIVCSRMIQSGTCGNSRRHYLDDIERIVVRGLRAELGTRDAVPTFWSGTTWQRRRSAAWQLGSAGHDRG